MIIMSELLEDKAFREFMLTPPRTPKVARSESLSPMWVVYLQKSPNGKWRRKSLRTYKEAFKLMKKALKMGYHDAAIHNKRIGFDPPNRIVRIKGKYFLDKKGRRTQVTRVVIWQPKLPIGETDQHFWCRACRRPTVWKHYSKHQAMPQFEELNYNVRRCCICGGSERINMNFSDRRRG